MCVNLVLRRIPVVQKRYDTVHGKFKHDVKIGEKDELIVNGNKIKCIQASREGPKALPWKDGEGFKISVVCENLMLVIIIISSSSSSSPDLGRHCSISEYPLFVFLRRKWAWSMSLSPQVSSWRLRRQDIN